MGQRSNYAVVKDAQIKLNTEESASSMGQSSNYVARKDAQIKPPKHRWTDGQMMLSTEESANGMGQRSENAAVKGAQIKFEMEDCALNMGYLENAKNASGLFSYHDALLIYSASKQSNLKLRLIQMSQTLLYSAAYALRSQGRIEI